MGSKQLKSRLSEYLRLVRGGETVLITDRDEAVVELRPTRKQSGADDSLHELLESLADTRRNNPGWPAKATVEMESRGTWPGRWLCKRSSGQNSQRSVAFGMSICLYLDSSAVLRAIPENGTTPEIEALSRRLPPWLRRDCL